MTNTRVAVARESDPETSHQAAKKATVTKLLVSHKVLHLASQLGMCIGSEMNEAYRKRHISPACAWDSPRKRAGELAADGFLTVLGTRDGESEYVVSYDGWEYLKALGLA